jgi:hypothetical protein
MIIAAIVSVTFLVALFVLVRVMRLVQSHVAYYLPSVTLAQLSKQLSNQLALSDAIAKRMGTEATELATATSTLVESIQRLDIVHDAMVAAIQGSLDSWLSRHTPAMLEDAIRSVALRVSNNLQMGLIDRTTKLGGEYVLLQTLDDLEVSVQLKASSYEPKAIREALVRVLKWHAPRERKLKSDEDLASWLIEATRTRREFDELLGRMGDELFALQWNGAVALRAGKPANDVSLVEGIVSTPVA